MIPFAELLWLESKQKVRDKNYMSMFPELTYEMAVTIRSMGLDRLREVLKEQNVDEGE